jgi:hypothetical protein
VVLVLSGCILTFSQFLCAAVSSALTASLVGVGKSVLQTLIGFFTFGGVPFHPLNILGWCPSYSWIKCILCKHFGKKWQNVNVFEK